jgi:hypothetical protein
LIRGDSAGEGEERMVDAEGQEEATLVPVLEREERVPKESQEPARERPEDEDEDENDELEEMREGDAGEAHTHGCCGVGPMARRFPLPFGSINVASRSTPATRRASRRAYWRRALARSAVAETGRVCSPGRTGKRSPCMAARTCANVTRVGSRRGWGCSWKGGGG